MPKLILSSRYLCAAPPGHLSNYIRYISIRGGVEMIDESKKHLPTTIAQKKFIEEMIRDIPAAKDMLEYTDLKTKMKSLLLRVDNLKPMTEYFLIRRVRSWVENV